MSSKSLREARADKLAEMQLLSQKLKDEKRSTFTEQENAQFDLLDREQEALLAQAETFERMERVEGLTRSESQQRVREEVLTGATRGERYELQERQQAIAGWLTWGTRHLKPEFWRAAERQNIHIAGPEMRVDWLPWKKREQRGTNNQVIGTNGLGGFIVPTTLQDALDRGLKYVGSVFEWADVIDTASGAPITWGLNDDTAVNASVIGEGSGATIADTTFARNQLSAYKFESMMTVSWEFEQDALIDLPTYIGETLGERLARGFNAKSVATGTGSGEPTALLANTTLGATFASATELDYTGLITLYHSVDPAYRAKPSCGWVFSDNVLLGLRGLTDGGSGSGRPLMMSALEGIALGIPNSLLGKAYNINQDVPTRSASNKTVIFGDLKAFKVRRVNGGFDGGVNIIRLTEYGGGRELAGKNLTGFLAVARLDSLLFDPGTHPVKHAAQHS